MDGFGEEKEMVLVVHGAWWRWNGWMAGWRTATPAWPRRRPEVEKEG